MALPTDQQVKEALPPAGQNALAVSKAATVVQVVNGLDLILGHFGIVPLGTIPIVVNGVVAIVGGVTHWWANRKATASALAAPPPQRFSSY